MKTPSHILISAIAAGVVCLAGNALAIDPLATEDGRQQVCNLFSNCLANIRTDLTNLNNTYPLLAGIEDAKVEDHAQEDGRLMYYRLECLKVAKTAKIPIGHGNFAFRDNAPLMERLPDDGLILRIEITSTEKKEPEHGLLDRIPFGINSRFQLNNTVFAHVLYSVIVGNGYALNMGNTVVRKKEMQDVIEKVISNQLRLILKPLSELKQDPIAAPTSKKKKRAGTL